MNWIWASLLVSSVLAASFNGSMAAVTQASIDAAGAAVQLAIGLIGVMTFWLGMMRIVQDGGLLAALQRRIAPLLGKLFPEVPPNHPALDAVVMNIASNMLGLGNAATPFGLRAMAELQRLNPTPAVASNSMVLFLAINTSNVSIAPLGVIALRASVGSSNAGGIWLPTLLATTLSTAVAIVVAKLLERTQPALAPFDAAAAAPRPPAESRLPAAERPIRRALVWVVALTLLGAMLIEILSSVDGPAAALRDLVSHWTLPMLIAVIVLFGLARGVDVYDSAIAGAREGFETATRIIPFLVAIMVAVAMFRASGLLDALVGAIDPLTARLGFPAAALPMALLRPLSGSGAFAVLADTLRAHGPDTQVGYLVSTLQGSTETTFYVLAVYFGSVGITRYRHAIAAGLAADFAGTVGSVLAVRWLLPA